MFDSPILSDRKYELVVLLLLLLAAFLPRLLGFVIFIDLPGEGPGLIIQAYNWAASPYFISYGVTLPGYTYLAGLFSFLVNDPLLSSRILNLIIGTLTVPIFFLVIRRVFDRSAAIISASIFAFLPLHVGLSGSSLSDTSFLFAVLAGILLLLKATECAKRQVLSLSLSLLCFCCAFLTRYESWLLIPLIPSYYFWKTRKTSITITMILILTTIPLAWMVSNYLHVGHFLPMASKQKADLAKGGYKDPHLMDFLFALRLLIIRSVYHLGLIICPFATIGIILQFAQIVKGKCSKERVFYMSIICIFWIFILYFVLTHGGLYDRYLLFGFVLFLPLAVLPLNQYFSNYQRWLVVIILVFIISVNGTYLLSVLSGARPSIGLYPKRPTEIKRVAVWLRKSSYRDDPILMTPIHWQSKHLPLYYPEIISYSRHLVVSRWITDSRLQDFLKTQQPTLFLTAENDWDSEVQSRIEDILGKRISGDRLVHREGIINVYDLRPFTRTQN